MVSSVLIHEGEGVFREHLGGYDTYTTEKKPKKITEPVQASPKPVAKLSFNEQRELSKLPQQIEVVENKINELHLKMADPLYYQNGGQALQQALKQQEDLLAELYQRWELLEEKKTCL